MIRQVFEKMFFGKGSVVGQELLQKVAHFRMLQAERVQPGYALAFGESEDVIQVSADFAPLFRLQCRHGGV